MRVRAVVLMAGLFAVACEPEDTGGGGGVGGKIAYERDNNIWVAKDDGTGEKQLTTDGKGKTPAFSPNGLTIAFEHEGEIWTVLAAGGTASKLVGEAGKSYRNPFWAKETIVFEIFDAGQTRVAKVHESGSGQADVISAPAYRPTLDKDATKILLFYGGSPQSLGTAPIAGANPTTVTTTTVEIASETNSVRAVYSPAGGKMAFTSKESGKYRIFIASAADGSGAVKVAGTASDDLWPAFSPDGTLVAFHSAEGGQETIYLVPTDGSKPFEPFLAGKNATWGP